MEELNAQTAHIHDLVVGSGRVITGLPNFETIEDEYYAGVFNDLKSVTLAAINFNKAEVTIV